LYHLIPVVVLVCSSTVGSDHEDSLIESRRNLLSDDSFLHELFGSRAHVDTTMVKLGWTRPLSGTVAEGPGDEERSDGELFLWATLMGRAEIAEFFWRRCP
jgi:hypothetical protein